MLRLKVISKQGRITIKERIQRGEEINIRELELFNRKLIRGFMRPNWQGGRKIVYTSPDGVTLKKYLERGISKNEFFLVFAQIIEVTKKIDRNGFNINNLVLNPNYIFVNEMTREVNFLYQPFISQNVSVNIFSFLYDVIYMSVFKLEEDTKFLNELMNYLKGMQFFSSLNIENYILKTYPQVYKQIIREKPGQSQNLREREWTNNSSSLRNVESDEEGTMMLEEESDATALLEEDGTALLYEEDNEEGTALLFEENNDTALLDDNADLLMEDDEGTAVLIEDEGTALLNNQGERYPYLIRMFNYEHIDLNKPVFRIGKEKSYVDYFVMNNNKVSRLHSDIITDGNRYFIKDNNSTNGTFVNGEIIERNSEVEIFDLDCIRLANEEFEFHVE